MKIKKHLIFLFIPFIVTCSKINDPVELESDQLCYEIKRESLKKIYQLKTWGEWEIRKHNYYVATGKEFDYGYTKENFHQTLQNENMDIRILRAGILQLPLLPINETENILLDILNKIHLKNCHAILLFVHLIILV